MSLRLAMRRLALSGPALQPHIHPPPPPPQSPRRRDYSQHRKFDLDSELDNPQARQDFLTSRHSPVSTDSIFGDEIAATPAQAASDAPPDARPSQKDIEEAFSKTRKAMRMVLDPNPRGRVRWLRRKVIQMVRNPDHITPQQRIRASERELTHASPFMGTSTKKLTMLARQVAGMPIDKAIQQMRWSKKKFAKEVRYHLEEARDLAVVQSGMGLGTHKGEIMKEPRKIKTKDGKWLTISDPTRIYVAQSWVGKGPWRAIRRDYKGRGKSGVMKSPAAKITFILKEEKTRLRENDERKQKEAAKGPWVHHPNRSVPGQRPYYSW